MGQVEIAPSRLRHGAEHLFGREEELAALDQAWNNPSTHVLSIVAWGGVGKTSLVVEWMARQAAAGWSGFERVFDWSFYSQGTREQGAASADAFVAAALDFFGDPALGRSAASPWDKGARLAQLIGQRRCLLVLDGLEPLQHPPGPVAGQLRDPALAALLRGLAQRNPGLCLVTTRERVADIAPFRDTTAPVLELQHLSTPAGVELLKTLGVRGTEAEFQRLVEDVAGHALTLNLLGRYLAKAHQGDIRRRDQVEFEKADAEIQGGHAFRVMLAYEQWLSTGGERGQCQLAVLRLLGLFDRPADAGCLAALRDPKKEVIPGLTEPLVGLAEDDWNLTLSNLADCGLVSVRLPSDLQPSAFSPQPSLDAHPLIREYFARQLREKNPEAWRSAHRRLYEHLKDITQDRPEPTDRDLLPLYQALTHGCQAGIHQCALDEIYGPRIARGPASYSTRHLSLFRDELTVLASFFERQGPTVLWERPLECLKGEWPGELRGIAGSRLRALGDLRGAIAPLLASRDWYRTHAAERFRHRTGLALRERHLSEVFLALGALEKAEQHAAAALDAALESVGAARSPDEQSKGGYQKYVALSIVGTVLHHQGRWTEAKRRFSEAEDELRLQSCGRMERLYSLWGFRYGELLLDLGEFEEVRTRAAVLRGYWRAGLPQQDPEQGLDFLGRTLEKLLEIKAELGRPKSCASDKLGAMFTEVVEELKRAGRVDFKPYGYLARARFRSAADMRVEGDSKPDFEEAERIVWGELSKENEMPLHAADYSLELARLELRQGRFTEAGRNLEEAGFLIEKHAYGRRIREVIDLRAALAGKHGEGAGRSVLFYISGHGYGHSVRMTEVIRALARLRRGDRIVVKTTAPSWLFDSLGAGSLEVRTASIDTGVVEDGSSLSIDVEASVNSLGLFLAQHQRLMEAEIDWVRSHHISLIVADIPYLAGEIAAAAGVPCIGISNFLWNWIYEPLLAGGAGSSDFLALMRRGYSKMQTMLRLPFAHQMDCFANVTDVPLVTAVGARTTEETRHTLRIEANDSRPVVFLAMRAHVPPEVVKRAASGSPEFVFVALSKREAGFPENLRSVRLGPEVSFADVVAAADIVVSKPGYGIVAACAAHETNLLYPRRDGFREDEVLLAEAPRYTRIREIPRAAYETGMWAEHLQALRQQPEAKERPGLHGADVCARIIADHLERR